MRESIRLEEPSRNLRDSYRSLIAELESEEFSAERGEVVQRYWINLES